MMSDSGDSCAMSDTGESRITSEAEDSSALSDWSMVDSHGELPDDETASTSSSVEVVDEGNDETNVEAVTPIAGSPNVITPRFILRLTSQNEDGSDTDEDKQESVTCSGPQEEVTKDTPAHVKAGQSFQQSSPEARVSREEIEELRQTIDNLKKNLLPSQAEDNSVSSIDLFGDGKSDENNVTTDNHLPPERENSGFHGNKIDDSLSQGSSVSSSYSFLSRDTGTACFLLGGSSCLVDGTGNKTDLDREITPEVDEMLGTSDQTCTNNTPTKQENIGSLVYCDTIEADSELATINPGHQSGGGFWQFMSQFFEYPVKYIFLIGLVAYAGVIIVTVYSIHTQGQGDSQELGVLHQCHSERKEMQIKLDTCDKDVLDSKALIKSSAQKLEALRKENSEILEQLGNKEKEVMKLRDNVDALVKENERLTEADRDHLQAQRDLLGEIEMLQSQVDQSTSDCANTKQSLDKCLKEGEELKQQKIDIESNKYNSDMEFSAVQKQCQTDTDNLRSQYQFEIDNIGKQYQSDLDRIRKQHQSDLDQIKNDYQSNLDSLTMHTTAKNKYTQSQNTEDGKCDKNGNECTEFWGGNVGS
ncbi:uncharacterized protein LOC132757182 [Ruditapes philippinarum]|uniref:uncharacterized protein LOC132757182 n=1 Tax=Ruditapes philippinarum TaxID=129788 RepID=UPI00295BBB3A|nr:uncharacterized protein LOC132757182 [Ruditapes philippinarum]